MKEVLFKKKLAFIAVLSCVVAFFALLRVATLECGELECLINFFFSIPVGLAFGTLLFFILLSGLLYARGSGFKLNFVVAFVLALGFGILASLLLGGNVYSFFTLLQVPFSFYIGYVWWLFLMVFILCFVVLKFHNPLEFDKRFWAFVVIAGLIPALVGGISYSYVMSTYSTEAHAVYTAKSHELFRTIAFETKRVPFLVKSGDVEACKSLKEHKDLCYAEFAKSTGDSGFCKSVKEADWKASCYFDSAITSRDVALCEKVDDFGYYGYKIESCKAVVNALNSNNPLACKSLVLPSTIGGEPYPDHPNIEFCLTEYAVELLDEQVCFQMDHKPSRDSCLVIVAIAKRDVGVCNLVENDNRAYCYANLASEFQDESVCDGALNSKQTCLGSFFSKEAIRLNDVGLCDSIGDIQSQKSCKSDFGVKSLD